MPACMLLAPHDSQVADLVPLLASIDECNCQRTYVATPGAAADGVNQQLLDWLCQLYGAAGAVNPRMNVIPCLPCAGWTAEQLTTLTDVQLLFSHASLQQQAQQLQQTLNSMRAAEAAVQLQPCPAPGPVRQDAADHQAAAAMPHEQQQGGPAPQLASETQQHREIQSQSQSQSQQKLEQEQQQQQQPKAELLLFSNVAVGGTFDRLHAGHRLLLAATALVSTAKVFIGITADSLLAKKANKHLLQAYEQRRAAAVDFMALVRPGLSITAGPLCDPLEPTQAELDPSMQALVVSQETLPGGEAINAARARRGFAAIQLVVVGLVGGSAPGDKLSSTALRQADAAGSAAAAPAAAGSEPAAAGAGGDAAS